MTKKQDWCSKHHHLLLWCSTCVLEKISEALNSPHVINNVELKSLSEDKPNPSLLNEDSKVQVTNEKGEVLCTCGHIKQHHQANEDLGCVALGLGKYACDCSKFCEEKKHE